MGLSFKLIGFPLVILAISIMMQTAGALQPGGTTVAINGQGVVSNTAQNTDCSAFNYAVVGGTGPCLTILPLNGQISCNNNPITGNTCYILSYCPSATFLIAPLWCNAVLGKTFLQPGNTVVFTGGTPALSSNAFTAVFGAIGPTGFTVMVGVAIGLAALAGITVFGSGENAESVHILFMGGMLLGLWGILSIAEGFITGNANSFFVELNSAFANLGTSFYVVLTLVYTLGIVGAISRGDTSS